MNFKKDSALALPRKTNPSTDEPVPRDRLTVSFLLFKVEGIGTGVKLALMPVYVFAVVILIRSALGLFS